MKIRITDFFSNTNNIMPMFAILEFFDGDQDFLFVIFG